MNAYPPNSGSSKKSKSLSWKLSFSQLRQHISSYFKIDFFIIILFAVLLIIWSEYTAETTYRKFASSKTTSISELETDTISLTKSNVGEGLRFFRALEKNNIVREGSYRKISTSPTKSDLTHIFSRRNNFPSYKVFLPTDDGLFLAVSVSLEVPLALFIFAFTLLLLYQLFSLPFIIIRSRNRIRAALAPIYQLTATAQTISSNTDNNIIHLSGTIDALNTITGNQLDRRISISDEREELQGLAQAINDMLDRLDLSYKAQLQFVSDASHELRTPISIIQGYAQLINRWGKDDPKTLEESIDAIQSETESMQILVEQLLFLARSDNRSLKMDSATFNLSELMEEVQEETKMINKSHNILSVIEPSIFVIADIQLIKQAVRILVDNAIKYTPEGGRITLVLDQKNDIVYISINDNGIGISPDNLENLFNRFWRADSSRTRKTGGTGLGLSIAKWIAESHSGFIEVVSRENLGSKFTIGLPLSMSAALPDISNPPKLTVLKSPSLPDPFLDLGEAPSLEEYMDPSSFPNEDIS